MRILYINHVSQMSGAEHSLWTLLQRLPRDEYQPIVALPSEGPLSERLASIGIETVFAPLVRLKRTFDPRTLVKAMAAVYRASRALADLVRQRDIDLIHANSATAHFVAGRVGQATHRPVVWHARDLTDIPFGKGFLNRSAARIIAVSEAVRLSLMRQNISADKIRVIHNGVDIKRFNPDVCGRELRHLHGVPENGVVFGMVAQLAPWKRHDVFLAAAGDIAHAYPQSRFWIVGDDLFGDHSDYVASLHQQVKDLGLPDKVKFLGYQDKIEQVMAGMEALVLPSDGEPFGRVVVEAMAMEKPVIVTRAGGPLEIIHDGHDGILIPLHDATALASAMEQMITRPQWRHRLGEAARHRVRRGFSIEEMTQRIVDLYHEVWQNEPLGSPRRPERT